MPVTHPVSERPVLLKSFPQHGTMPWRTENMYCWRKLERTIVSPSTCGQPIPDYDLVVGAWVHRPSGGIVRGVG